MNPVNPSRRRGVASGASRWIVALSLALLCSGCIVRRTRVDTAAYNQAPPPPGVDTAQSAAPVDEVDQATFERELSPYGMWLVVPVYGTVWVPRIQDPSWRPYTRGHWVQTVYGWTWVSDWPWGWAPFHYGRWAYLTGRGWVWVPGTVWGPAWVSWRSDDTFIGWAPLPPAAVWRSGVGLLWTGPHLEARLELGWWSFVELRWFLAPSLVRYYVGHHRHREIWGRTRVITRYEWSRGRVVNRCVDVGRIERATHRRVPLHTIRYVGGSRDQFDRGRTRGREVPMYRPHRDPRVAPRPDPRTARPTPRDARSTPTRTDPRVVHPTPRDTRPTPSDPRAARPTPRDPRRVPTRPDPHPRDPRVTPVRPEPRREESRREEPRPGSRSPRRRPRTGRGDERERAPVRR
ncbi:MAG: hypothetical protein H6837_13180 [Planctomycetes bacterium]|nr:hypothetical protein [Planctomycetota bacterium]